MKNKLQKDNNFFYDNLDKLITEKFPCPVKPPYSLEVNNNRFIFYKTLPFEILSPVTGKLTLTHNTENIKQIRINVKNKYELIFVFSKVSPSLITGKEIIKNQYIGECKNTFILYVLNLQEKKNNKCQKPSALTEES